jgi:hypothetical protein
MPTPGNTVRAVFSAANTGGEQINTGCWFFLNSTPPSQADLNGIATDLATNWNVLTTNLKGHWYAGVSWQFVNVYYYAGGSNHAAMQAVAALAANVGTRAGGGSPIDTCSVVSLRTGFPGRSQRGRMYLPQHDTVSATTGQIVGTTATDFANNVALFLNTFSGARPGWGAVVSRTLGSSLPITQVLCDTIPDVQRRRENKMVASAVQSAIVTP